MRASCWWLVGALGLGCMPVAQADEGDGLAVPRLQGRVKLGMGTQPGAMAPSGSNAQLRGASVLGDYYFAREGARGEDSGGFRATTGVFLGSQLGLWGGPPSTQLSGSLLIVERHSFSLLVPGRGSDFAGLDTATVPYVGVGYSGFSLKGGWGFSADVGLMALNPGSAVRLGRAFGGSGQSLDDVLREVRLSPLVQVGVSYQF